MHGTEIKRRRYEISAEVEDNRVIGKTHRLERIGDHHRAVTPVSDHACPAALPVADRFASYYRFFAGYIRNAGG